MTVQMFFNVLLALGGIAVFVVVGRSNLRKQLIEDLKALVEVQEKNIARLTKRVRFLEDLIWNAHLVDKDPDREDGRGRRGSRPASSEPPEDEGDG